jgi:hypothetical protein
MNRYVPTLVAALGLAMLAGGCFAFIYGMTTATAVEARGLGPLNGVWHPPDFCWVGAILGSAGCGLSAFGAAWVALLLRHGPGAAPRRSWLVWSLALAVGVGGVAVAGAVVWASRGSAVDLLTEKGYAAPPQEDVEQIKRVAATFNESWNRDDLTPELRKRMDEKGEVTSYVGHATAWVYGFGPDGAVAVGHIRATGVQKRHWDGQGQGPQIRWPDVRPFPAPQRVDVMMRFVKTKEGRWLVDEVEYRER